MSSIPIMDFRGSKFVNPDGTLTDVAQSFFDILQQILVSNFGNEGIVSPSQDSTSIQQIQNNINTSASGLKSSTCQLGTFIYNTDINKVVVSLDDGSGNPVFKQVLTT